MEDVVVDGGGVGNSREQRSQTPWERSLEMNSQILQRPKKQEDM